MILPDKKLHIKDKTFARHGFLNNPLPSKHITWVREDPGPDDWCVYTDLCLTEAREYPINTTQAIDYFHDPDPNRPEDDTSPANKNIAWLIDPVAYIPDIYEWVLNNTQRFAEIWTHDSFLLSRFLNGINLGWVQEDPATHSLPRCSRKGTFIPVGGCRIDREDQQIHKKTKDFSIISSATNPIRPESDGWFLNFALNAAEHFAGWNPHTGDNLRHSIVAAAGKEIDTFGEGHMPIQDRIASLREYRYHFAVENIRQDFWFTEKLIDCFRTGTVPIFWGCPSIYNFFNTKGMKIFEKLTDLPSILKECTEEEYKKMLPHIKENFELAEQYIFPEEYIYNKIK